MKYDQLAIYADNNELWEQLAKANDCDTLDVVTAVGHVTGTKGLVTNVAQLAFNYDHWPMEFEVLHDASGANWLATRETRMSMFASKYGNCGLSHFGRHVETEAEIDELRSKHRLLQEVVTVSHVNAAIAGKRWYHYVIFDTLHEQGADLKLIRRLTAEQQQVLLRKLSE